MRRPILLCLAVAVVLPHPAAATLIRVLPDGSGDVPTIGAALSIAAYGDTVQLGSGTFREHDLPLRSGVRLFSETGDPATTVIDAEAAGRCLIAASLYGPPVIWGITLRNGTHPVEGGLVLVRDGTSNFVDCVFLEGSAPRGGAVAALVDDGPDFFRCRFESNEAMLGGAIYTDAVVGCNQCEFIDNVAQGDGGAVYAQKNILNGMGAWITSSTFVNNRAAGDGGALFSTGENYYFGSALYSCTLTGNTATNGGAARLSLYDCVSSCRFLENQATGRGGALYTVELNTALAKDCDRIDRTLFARNRAVFGGACALASNSGIFFYETTFAQNDAPWGGHLWTDVSSSAHIWRVILAFATAGGSAVGSSGAATCSVVYGNVGGDWVGPFAGENGVSGNRSEDPLFCDMAADDYTLHEGSPCLPPQPPDCGYTGGIVGAYGQGCGAVSVSPSSWGRTKARFR